MPSPKPPTVEDRLTAVAKLHACSQARAHFQFAARALDEDSKFSIDDRLKEARRQAGYAFEWLNAVS